VVPADSERLLGEALHAVVDWLCDHWDQPDKGIWETPGGRKNFVYSRLMSWVAIDRAMRIASRRGLPAELERWGRLGIRSIGPSWSAVGRARGRHSSSTRAAMSWTLRC
jgi:hypothetical protein